MMTSVGDQSWGTPNKLLSANTQTSQTQRQVQATAEQIRLAQMIYNKNDADFEDKVIQLMEVTGKSQDDCMVALHDCNEDVNKAINFLLEGSSDVTSWETVGRRRVSGKDSPSLENKENREKRGDKEALWGRGGAPKKGRGASRGRDVRSEENGIDHGLGERHLDRSGRGNSRGRGRGSAHGGSRFSAQGMGTFNPADYTPGSDTRQVGVDDTSNRTGSWHNVADDWAVEDWNEDLSETKVFTASSVPVTEHRVTAGQSLDLASLLQKPTDEVEPEGSEQALGHSLVFTNSHLLPPHGGPALSYAHATLSSVSSSFRHLDRPKPSSSAGVQSLELMKDPGPMPSQQQSERVDSDTVTSSSVSNGQGGSSSSSSLQPLGSQTVTLLSSEFSRDPRTQPEPSVVLSQLALRHQGVSSGPVAQPPSLPTQPAPSVRESSKPEGSEGPCPDTRTPLTSSVLDTQPCATHQRQAKTQKRRPPPTSKIPLTAVEMPGSADLSGLNVQFGALDFALDPALQDHRQPEKGSDSNIPAVAGASQPENLHSRPPGSHHPPVSLLDLPPSTLGGCASAHTPPLTSALPLDSSLEGILPPHSHLAFSQTQDSSPTVILNGGHGTQTPTAADSTSTTATQIPDSLSQATSSFTPATSAPTHSAVLPVGMPESLADHNRGASSSCSSSSSITCSSVDTANSLPSLLGSVPSIQSCPGAVIGGPTGSGDLGLTGNRVPVPAVCRTAPLPPLTNKASPNLAQGAPPLLPNQYIVGPGGLLPAYPIYGYEDLHMLRSRLPVDCYGMAFPSPSATSPSRDGNVPSGPCSGEVTKFGRGDSVSPAPPSTTPTPLPPQPAPPNQSQQQPSHSSPATFLNPALPPGYTYPGLPYYPGLAGVPGTFQYGPTIFVPPTSAKQQVVGGGGTSGSFQQHSYSSGCDDLTQGPSDTGSHSPCQAQAKSAAMVSVVPVTSSSGTADSNGFTYKTQAFEKQLHHGTTAPFSLPSALGNADPLNPGGSTGYAPGPVLHIFPAHQQPHNQLVHHALTQDNQGRCSQRSQSSMQQKSQTNKSTYGSSPYWGN